MQKAVRWARKYGVRIAARAGGHSYGGYSTTTGLVVDVTRLGRVQVAADGASARIGAGASLIDVYEALWRRGVTIPAGSCPDVGIAGLALGGGVGFSSRKLGLTCDNVEELTIVTAPGDALAASDREQADLFWACRGGGGGNFGIVTGFTFRTSPVSAVATYSVQWPWESAAAALQAWQAWAPVAPDELFSAFRLQATGAKGPAERPRVASTGQLFGSEAELRSLLAPLTDAAEPSLLNVTSRSYIQAVRHWAGGEGPRRTFAATSDYATAPLSREAIGVLVKAIAARQASSDLGSGSVLMDSYGGAVNRVPPAATAFVHRNALFSLQYLAYWDAADPPRVAAANLAWLRSFHAAMRPFVSGFAYQDYIDPDLATWKHAYYGSNYARLVRVKRRVDPGNLFRFAQSIPLRD